MIKKLLFFLILTIGLNLNAQDELIFDGLTRDYITHVPATYNSSDTVPLVLNLHGLGSNSLQQLVYSGFNEIANANNFIVVYPDGIENAWNVGFSGVDEEIDDVGFLNALIDTLSSQYNIDPERIYSTGMSNGGYMSYRLACELDHKIAAIASVTGSMTPIQIANCNPERKMPILQFHGTVDATVPYDGAIWTLSMDDLIEFWVDHNNCEGEATITEIPNIVENDFSTVSVKHYEICDEMREVILYTIDNGGHTWPGASDIAGITNKDIDASQLIWEFFSRHQLTPEENCTDPCAPNFNPDAETDDGSCEEYDSSCPVNTCYSEYSWDSTSCSCIELAIDYFCDDNDECTSDFVNETICECVNEPIAGCGQEDWVIGLESLNEKLEIFPNPVNQHISFNEVLSNAQLTLFDLSGKTILDLNNFSGQSIILPEMNAGLYILKIEIEGAAKSIKLYKE